MQKKLKDIQALKVPIWKLKPTELPQKPWYAEDLSLKRARNGKLLDEVGAKKQEENEAKLKEMYDPLRVGLFIAVYASGYTDPSWKTKANARICSAFCFSP